VIDGMTGKPIPCRCRYGGRTYQLGDVVCMRTYLGTVLTRCELYLNNTSWMPTREPCTISGLSPTTPLAFLSGLRGADVGRAATCCAVPGSRNSASCS
jgi:hypothetical protein